MAKGFENRVEDKRHSVCSSRVPPNRRQSANSCVATDINSNQSEAEVNTASSVINPLLTIMPTVRSQPSLHETEAVARELFTQFTREQLHSEGISFSTIDEQLQQFTYLFVITLYYFKAI